MTPKSLSASLIAMILVGLFFVVCVSFLLPWKLVSWGKIGIQPVGSVTVVGEAKSQEKTQVAQFSAGVNAYGDDKQIAVNDVNKKVDAIIQAVKEFGVNAEDIKTQSLNIYQNQEQYYDAEGRQKYRAGQWNVSNTIEVKLSDVDRASPLASVLTKSGATNVNGPNFSFDDTTSASNELFDQALKNAGEKAAIVAQSSGRKLGKIISVIEGYAPSQTFFRMEGGGGGGGIEPGSGTVNKIVTVTYELE